ncbi:MAG TPA: hypothetical protein VKG45_03975 [Actinomycetes bacterium]|nr:hypothetical protein [Actinomycetes bacterium]
MPADARTRVPPAAAAAAAAALAAAVVVVVTRPSAARPLAAGLLAAGFAAGLALGAWLTRRLGRGPARHRSAAERLNDGAFAVVLLAGWLLALAQLGAWAGLLTGLAAGVLAAFAVRAARRPR